MRKILSIIVLVSMTLHCATRLGVVSFLYQKRHHIAHSVGLIESVPIAVCNSDHDFGKGLHIHDHEKCTKELPSTIVQAREINLFHEPFEFEAKPTYCLISEIQLPGADNKPYLRPSAEIFRPPIFPS